MTPVKGLKRVDNSDYCSSGVNPFHLDTNIASMINACHDTLFANKSSFISLYAYTPLEKLYSLHSALFIGMGIGCSLSETLEHPKRTTKKQKWQQLL